MATQSKKTSMNVDLQGLTSRFSSQFRGLDFQNPSAFPVIPRYALLALVTLVVLGVLWFIWLSSYNDQLSAARDQENRLRQDYAAKLQKAVILPVLQEQKKEVTRYVDSLEKQLPGKSEMDALLSDINQAGLERNLQFELFKPGTEVPRQYYIELPITLKIIGHYHDIGAFAADVAGLSRIVTLNELNLTPADRNHPDQLTLNATARTFRYLDPDEVKAQANAKGGKK